VRLNNRYIFFLVLVSCLVNTLLAFFEHEDLSTYLIINIVSFLVITLIFTPSNPKAKKTFNILNIFLFACFLAIVITEFTGAISGK
jgi:hypothetical protein